MFRWFLYNPNTRMIVSWHRTYRDAKAFRRDNLEIGDTTAIEYDETLYWE